MLNSRIARVLRIPNASSVEAVQEVIVDVDGREARAVCYPDLSGPVSPGDEVLINTTAVDLHLGTGGVHFVICNLSNPTINGLTSPGHIMKLRYTPLQAAVLSAEENDSPFQDRVLKFKGLRGIPVICCELHSQIAPAAAAIKALTGYRARIACVMTDGAALPIHFSKLVAELKDKGLLDATITCGQAFGGDFEAINIYTALIAAVEAAGADAIIVSQGPGNAGAGTKYGFSGIQQGEALNAVNILGGRPIAVVRMSFADPRERHQGISHHSITILGEIVLKPVAVAIPELPDENARIIQQTLVSDLDRPEHEIRIRDGERGLRELEERGIRVTTMGRTVEQDREFFLAASAAGVLAAEYVGG